MPTFTPYTHTHTHTHTHLHRFLVICSKSLHLFLGNKHHLLTIHVLIPTVHHPNLPCRQLPAIRLQRLNLGARNPPYILLQMLVPGHDSLAFHIALDMHRPLCFGVHFARDESEIVGAGEEHVEGGFELEHGLEDGAAAENVQAQTGAGEGDGQAADVAQVAD